MAHVQQVPAPASFTSPHTDLTSASAAESIADSSAASVQWRSRPVVVVTEGERQRTGDGIASHAQAHKPFQDLAKRTQRNLSSRCRGLYRIKRSLGLG
jgi:adenosyl cobinamide kinase/adenosyl cobinamide phosphate guanylyltransferase